MKIGWKIIPLQSLCNDVKQDIVDGPFGSELQRKDYINEGIPVLKIQNIKPFAIELKKMDYVTPTKFQELKRHSYRRGDIVMTKLGSPLGVSAVVEDLDEGVIVADLVRIRAQRVNTKYLCYHLNSQQTNDFINSMQKGTTRPRVTLSVVRGLPIAIPSPEEQQRIVGILDEAFDGIATAKANAEKNLQNARALFESHLQAVFTQRGEGWGEKTLEEIATTFGRGKSKHRPRNAPHLYGGKYPFIQTGDIRNADHFITEYSQTYSEAGLAQSKLWPKGTICITIAANIAETGILRFDACFPDSVIGIVANPKEADDGFIEYLLQSFKVKIQAMGKGSAQANINMGTFENERFPFPPVSEQKQIVAKLDSLSEETQRLESIYRRKLAALDELKKSLLHKAFSGELTEQWRRVVVIPFPTKISGVSTTDLHAGILATAFQMHEKNGRQKYFGHVKAEKIAHMVEAHLGIDLDRTPVKDAAGPNDFRHLKGVEHRAKMAKFFDFQRVKGAGYRVTKYRRFEELIEQTREKLGDRSRDVDSLIELMLPMDTEQAEIFTTVYAAWNNLLLDKQPITDESIVFEARENWHPDKLRIERWKFFKAIEWIKEHDLIPQGRGKKVNSRVQK